MWKVDGQEVNCKGKRRPLPLPDVAHIQEVLAAIAVNKHADFAQRYRMLIHFMSLFATEEQREFCALNNARMTEGSQLTCAS